MKSMKSCGGNWLTITLRKGLVYQQTHSFFFAALYLPIFFLYITVQFGTQLLLFLLSVYLECHKSSQIRSLFSVNKLLSFSEIRLSTTENKDWVCQNAQSPPAWAN